MKHRKVALFAAIAFAGGVFLAISARSANVPEKVTIDGVKKAKPAVIMPHAKHANEIAKGDCASCHHKWNKASGKDPQKCTNCHKATAGAAPAAKKVFHKQCKDCHKKNKAKGAPTSCKGCHNAK